MITVNDIAVEFGGTTLFSDVTFAINETDKIALMGKNGAGKSTLLKIVAGENKPSRGAISAPKEAVIAYLPQHLLAADNCTVMEEASKAFAEVFKMRDEIDQINESMIDLIDLGKKDGQPHDLTFSMSRLTIHFKNESEAISRRDLERHCEERKYIHKANLWFGICIGQEDTRLRFVVKK